MCSSCICGIVKFMVHKVVHMETSYGRCGGHDANGCF